MTQHTHTPAVAPQVGEIVAGKYKLERLLGAGGMGTVYAACHLELDRLVAVKFVHAGISENPEINARFLREARAVVKIESEHVAQVIDVGHLPDQTPFMVMEYLDGCDLSELSHERPIDVADAVDYLVQACSAMLEAHHKGIVHRDLKPANLFLTHRRDGSPVIKVLDFGISKWNEPDPSQAALTNPSVLMGSPAYMSPEQLRSARDVDHRTDIWSLGVILFELLAGRPAFDAESLPLLMTAIMRDEPPALASLRPDIDPELEKTILRCLKKLPADRYQSVAELANALTPWAPARSHYNIDRITKASGLPLPRISSIPASAMPRSAAASSLAGSQKPAADETAGTWVEEPRRSPSGAGLRRPVLLALGVVGLVAAVAAAFVLWSPAEAVETEPPGGLAGSGDPTTAAASAVSPAPTAVSPAPSSPPAAAVLAGPVSSAALTATAANSGSPVGSAAVPSASPPSAPRQPRTLRRKAPAESPPPEPKPARRNPLGMDLK